MEQFIQMGIVNFCPMPFDKRANLEKMKSFIREACQKKIQMLVFPAMSLTGDVSEHPDFALTLSEKKDGELIIEISKMAQEKNIWIIFGCTEKIENDTEHVYNSAFICEPGGRVRTIRQIQTEMYEWCLPGDEIGCIETPWGMIGIGVGEDILEYPEVQRLMGGWGCRLLLSISATKRNVTEDPKSWNWYIRNRLDSITSRDAIRVAFVNQSGNSFPGGSCVTEPQGWNVETEYLFGDTLSSAEQLISGCVSMDQIYEGALNLENNFVPFVFSHLYAEIAKDKKEGKKYTAVPIKNGPVVALAKTTTAEWGNVQKNLDHMSKLINEAATQKADIILFPETILQGYHYCQPKKGEISMHHRTAEPFPGQISNYFASLASKFNLFIVYGFAERAEQQVYNSAAVICPDGRQLVYRKISPHGPENLWCDSGSTPLIFETPWGKAGIIICMDGHSEPEIVRYYAAKGCSFILHCAATSGNRWYRKCRLLSYVDRDRVGVATVNTTGADGPEDNDVYSSVSFVANPTSDQKGNLKYDRVTGAPIDLHQMATEEADTPGLAIGQMDLSAVGFMKNLNAELYANEYARLGRYMEETQTYYYDLWNSHELEKIRTQIKQGTVIPAGSHNFYPLGDN